MGEWEGELGGGEGVGGLKGGGLKWECVGSGGVEGGCEGGWEKFVGEGRGAGGLR